MIAAFQADAFPDWFVWLALGVFFLCGVALVLMLFWILSRIFGRSDESKEE